MRKFIFIFFFFSCSFNIFEDTEIILPKNNFYSLYNAGELIYIYRGKKISENITIEKTIKIRFDKKYNSPIIFFPDNDIYPAAAFYPADFKDNKIELSWENGMIATVIINLPEKIYEKLNVEYIKLKCRKLDSNFWNLDSEKLYDDICSGNLNSYSFKKLKKFDLYLNDLQGFWIEQYLAGKVCTKDNFGKTKLSVKKGVNYFYSLEERKFIGINFDGRESIVMEIFY